MKNKLLIIAIDNYIHQDKLYTCKKDVIDFKNILLEKFDFLESDIYELINENATNKKIQDALSGFGKTLESDDNLIIFFSGHGDYNAAEDRGFWIPYDGTKEYTTWLPNETIITFIQKMKCKHLFLISDSCFSNSLLNQSQAKSNGEYNRRQSRWALTSAFDESFSPKELNSNSLFAETIIEFLEEVETEFRITKLIEFVKDSFIGNVMQTPQGSPIKVEGHKGGEMILTVNQSIDLRGLKGYKNFSNVLKLYKRNAKFEEIVIYEDKSKKIGFQLYKELDSVVKRLSYYIYLYTGTNQTQTLKYLQNNFSYIFENKNLITFIPKENDQLNLDKRLSNIKKKFKPINAFYIDDFIRDSCTPDLTDEDQSKLLHISNFILPTFYNSSNKLDVSSFIETWLTKDSHPILVIKGTGGIGKTTFAQYIADYAVSKSPKTFIYFIDSVQIKDNLIKRNKYIDKIGIYSFYEALFNQEDSTETKLTEELFGLNIDAGNIILIIDGLDEVISKIPKFDVESFLQSIVESSSELGFGKVIITCRTHFWNKNVFLNDELDIVELKPFDKNQTIEFFNKSFKSNRKCDNALKLADEFKFTSEDNEDVYHPYVLDIIRSIVIIEKESIELDLTSFSSKILNTEIKNDYIIYRVCDRERKRIGQISVDEQVKFFIYLAIERRGNIQTYNFKSEIEKELGRPIDQVNIEAFKSHPFLQNIGTSTTFRYDFFAELFKSMYIANYFNFNNSDSIITKNFIDIISENCYYGSGLNTEIVKRIKIWSDDDILLISDIIDQVAADEKLKLEKKRTIIANIFNISLSITHKFQSNDINSNTLLLKALFEKSKSEIVNLCLINLITEKNVRFDFSNLIIKNAFIESYSSFYDCAFNGDTKFIQCHLLNVESNNTHVSFPPSIFIDCIYDRNLEEAIKDFDNKQKSDADNAKSFINSFFKLFYSNGRLGRQWEEKIIKPRFNGIDKYNFGYKKAIKIMKQIEIIVSTNEKEGIKFAINDCYKEDVIRYVKDGTVSKVITDLIKSFSEK